MNFKAFDSKMRAYEESLDQIITKGNYIIVRLDGKSFHTLVDKYGYDHPFDFSFNVRMVDSIFNLIENSGFNISYAYTQSDEVSLLLDLNDDTYGRKVRKINSILASTLSIYFNLFETNKKFLGVFDSRVIPLPNIDLVYDYFLWRQEDANRNALNSYCYWTLRDNDYSKIQATKALENMGISGKNELLFKYGINYNNIPLWQKRGVGIYYTHFKKEGYNPITNSQVLVDRRKLIVNRELPIHEEYTELLKGIINEKMWLEDNNVQEVLSLNNTLKENDGDIKR